MPLSGEAIRTMNYVDDISVTLRRILTVLPSLTDEERTQIEERIEQLANDNPTLSRANTRTLDSATEPPSASVEVLAEYYFLRDIVG